MILGSGIRRRNFFLFFWFEPPLGCWSFPVDPLALGVWEGTRNQKSPWLIASRGDWVHLLLSEHEAVLRGVGEWAQSAAGVRFWAESRPSIFLLETEKHLIDDTFSIWTQYLESLKLWTNETQGNQRVQDPVGGDSISRRHRYVLCIPLPPTCASPVLYYSGEEMLFKWIRTIRDSCSCYLADRFTTRKGYWWRDGV